MAGFFPCPDCDDLNVALAVDGETIHLAYSYFHVLGKSRYSGLMVIPDIQIGGSLLDHNSITSPVAGSSHDPETIMLTGIGYLNPWTIFIFKMNITNHILDDVMFVNILNSNLSRTHVHRSSVSSVYDPFWLEFETFEYIKFSFIIEELYFDGHASTPSTMYRRSLGITRNGHG